MKLLKALLTIAIMVATLYLYIYNQISLIRVKNVKINSNKLSNSLKITQISDFHSNSLIDLEKMAEEIERFNPNFIVLTGDIIDYKDIELNTVFKLFKTIAKLDKEIYFIHGNHETNHRLYTELRAEMERLEINILEDNSITIGVNDEKINLTGLKSYSKARFNEETNKYQQAIKDLKLDYYNILLIHSPNNIESLINEKQDLVLSGHTHGGQFRLPIIGSIIAPGQGLFPKYDKGTFKINNATLYIDSGLGNSVAPLRFFNPVQFSNITIEPRDKD